MATLCVLMISGVPVQMLYMDPVELMTAHQRELMDEAHRARLASEVPHQPSAIRRELATVCYRLAHWLDAPAGYVQMPDPGLEDWVTPWASL
jgi:hypothetical protein